MINYRELYDSMGNTLTHELMSKIIKEYLTTGNIENVLKYSYYKEDEDENITEKEAEKLLSNHTTYHNKLYSMIFNVWKENIGNLTDEQVQQLIDDGVVGSDYYELRDYLKNTPYIDDAREFRKIIYGNEACSKYSRRVFLDTSWEHFFSRGLVYPLDGKVNVEHRLYLNPKSSDCYEMAYLFAEKCLSRNIPFYFKMDNGPADDKIVIYSDTEHLKDYISLLREIRQVHPDLASKTQKPPVLCGLIDDWVGYGSEPEENKESFNSKRRKLIEMVLDETIGSQKGQYQGKTVTLNDASVEGVRNTILQIGEQVGIDSNNFCFDRSARDKLFNYEDGIGSMNNTDTHKGQK